MASPSSKDSVHIGPSSFAGSSNSSNESNIFSSNIFTSNIFSSNIQNVAESGKLNISFRVGLGSNWRCDETNY